MLNIGVLRAARITRDALIKPAAKVDGVEVVAIAARDRQRATDAAGKHGIPRVLDSYEAMLADPQIDAVYIPLPNGLHGRWTLAAIDAGKHVLCEKPFTANAAEARDVARAANASSVVVMAGISRSNWPSRGLFRPVFSRRPTARRAAPRTPDYQTNGIRRLRVAANAR